jgi:hypothetical protein
VGEEAAAGSAAAAAAAAVWWLGNSVEADRGWSASVADGRGRGPRPFTLFKRLPAVFSVRILYHNTFLRDLGPTITVRSLFTLL